MKYLIINADDFGFAHEINMAVKECLAGKFISDCSIMAQGGAFNEAVDILKSNGTACCGVHLTLTGDMRPAASETISARTIIKKDGKFLSSYTSLGVRYLFNMINFNEVYRELKAQIKKVADTGLKVTHLDSHEHVHMFPRIFNIVVRLAEEFDIKFIRIPKESVSVITNGVSIKGILRLAALRCMIFFSGFVKKPWDIKFNNAFLGHYHSGNINARIINFLVKNVKNGLTELAVHPAAVTDDFIKRFPWYRRSGVEFNSILDKKWLSTLRDSDIRLVSYGDMVKLTL